MTSSMLTAGPDGVREEASGAAATGTWTGAISSTIGASRASLYIVYFLPILRMTQDSTRHAQRSIYPFIFGPEGPHCHAG